MDEKILAIKKQMLKYIYEKNIDAYIKIQTLYEYAIKQYVQLYYKYEDNDLKTITTWQLLDEYIPSSCEQKEKILEVFNDINIRANKGIKHFDSQVVLYDERIIKKTIKYLNNLINSLYDDNEKYKNLFLIDEDIFDNNGVVTSSYQFETNNNYIEYTNDETNTKNKNIINVGTSEQDYGFEVLGIKNDVCTYEYKSVYAVVFNLMQRSNIIHKDIIVEEFEKNKGLRVNYNKTYRYEMAILLLIKNNYCNNGEVLIYSKEEFNLEIECAIYHINKLFDMIANLMKQKIEKLKIIIDKKGISISFNNSGDINIIDSQSESNDKLIWYSQNIIYNIDENKDKETLEYLLDVLLNINSFREGQYEAICKILNNDISKIIIMPTGSGKSLIFYFISLMQPSPTIVVEPTEILIKDQIRNLKKCHNIDDCISYFGYDNDKININHNFIYFTPKVLQNKKSILSLISHNVDIKISNIVLDEIHTISNWSHDFRADYLMMSFNLKTFLDNSKYIGFTATANYRVIKDISMQLNVDFNDIHTPIELNNKKIYFSFYNVMNDDEAVKQVNQIAKSLEYSNDEKMLIFTKNSEISAMLKNNLADDLKFNVDVFSEEDENSYSGFINGRRSILISQSDMGIGINIPAIDKICHYGIPISKSKYVQEIGRAGRLLNTSYSYITYKDKEKLTNEELKLLDLNTSIDDILNIINNNNSDLAYSFKQILGHLSHYSLMATKIKDIYNEINIIEQKKKSHGLLKFKLIKDNSRINIETCLFFLVKMGLIYNWYVVSSDVEYITYDIEISDDLSLSTIKKKSIDYILIFGNSKETIYNIEESDNIENIIYELQTWYFEQFLMYHREQLVNMYDFVDYCRKSKITNNDISNELFQYFSLTSTDIDEDVMNYINKVKSLQNIKYVNDQEKVREENNTPNEIDTLKQNNQNKYIILLHNVEEKNDNEKLMQMEKYLESNYDVLADLYIFTYKCIYTDNINESRFKRITSNINQNEYDEFIDYSILLYSFIKDLKSKLIVINILSKYIKMETIIDKIFKYNKKDEIYYGFLSKRICERMEDLYE